MMPHLVPYQPDVPSDAVGGHSRLSVPVVDVARALGLARDEGCAGYANGVVCVQHNLRAKFNLPSPLPSTARLRSGSHLYVVYGRLRMAEQAREDIDVLNALPDACAEMREHPVGLSTASFPTSTKRTISWLICRARRPIHAPHPPAPRLSRARSAPAADTCRGSTTCSAARGTAGCAVRLRPSPRTARGAPPVGRG